MDANFVGVRLERAGWIGRERVRLWLMFVLGMVGLSAALFAAEEARAPFFQVAGGEAGVDALPLKSTRVDATLAGVIADVRVVQSYRNEGAATLEARYIFPGSTRAAVHGMTMTVGTRRIEAVIKEKAEARKTYETAKSAGRTASLLEAARSNVFEMSVANILPGDEVTVELRYTEMLLPVDGEYAWVFPTVVGPRYGGERAEGSGQMSDARRQMSKDGEGVMEAGSQVRGGGGMVEPVFTVEVTIAGGVPVREVTSVAHRVETSVEAGKTWVRLPASAVPQMNRDFILRYRLAGDGLASGLLVDEWNGEKFFLLTLQPPARVTSAQVPARDYIFVVDVSGSMHGFPLDVAKTLLSELLVTLRETDSFNVLLFSGASRVLAEAPVAATPENIGAALALITRQTGGGGTELLPALRQALDLPRRTGVARSVVVVTDGYVMVEAEAHALVRERLGEANLFAFGIGSSVNRELIERLARAGRAEPAVIEGPARAVEAAEKFRAMIKSPVLTQVRAEFRGFAAREVYPEVWPDVLAERPLVVVGKFSGEPSGAIALKGFSGAGLWEGKVDATNAVNLGGRGVLAQLWARERLEQLRDLHALGDEPVKRKAEIVALGLKYNLLTPFTSFVAVDTTVRAATNGVGDGKTVLQPSALPAGVSELAGGELVPTTPEPETVSLMIVAALVTGWGIWRARRKTKETEWATESTERGHRGHGVGGEK